MYGAFIGDIVGSKYEFHNIKTKRFPLFSEGCDFTDDTIMTVAVAEAILKTGPEQPASHLTALRRILIESMQSFGRRYPNPTGAYGSRFARWLEQKDPQPYGGFGNGAAMRVSPCGLIAVSLEEALALARTSASVSHNHPEGIKGAESVAAAVYLAKCGKTKAEIRKYIAENYYHLDFTLDAIRDTYRFNSSCQGSVPQAIMAFLESVSFEDAIRNVISIGGDCDTTGAITGSVAWAYYTVQSGGISGWLRDQLDPSMLAIKNEAITYLPKEFVSIADQFHELCGKRMKGSREFGIKMPQRLSPVEDHGGDRPAESSGQSCSGKTENRSGLFAGDTVVFGRYPQGKYGETEPIEWTVLEAERDKALLLSRRALITSGYCDSRKAYGNAWYLCWGNSAAREQCCGQFYHCAFDDGEKGSIIPCAMDAALDGPRCSDPVFLLSEETVDRLMPDAAGRRAEPSAYLIANQDKAKLLLDSEEDPHSAWWLLPQEPGLYPKAVFPDGEIRFHSRNIKHDDFTIRPAIYLRLSKALECRLRHNEGSPGKKGMDGGSRQGAEKKIIYFRLTSGLTLKIDPEHLTCYRFDPHRREWNEDSVLFSEYEHGELQGSRIAMDDTYPTGDPYSYAKHE